MIPPWSGNDGGRCQDAGLPRGGGSARGVGVRPFPERVCCGRHAGAWCPWRPSAARCAAIFWKRFRTEWRFVRGTLRRIFSPCPSPGVIDTRLRASCSSVVLPCVLSQVGVRPVSSRGRPVLCYRDLPTAQSAVRGYPADLPIGSALGERLRLPDTFGSRPRHLHDIRPDPRAPSAAHGPPT